MARGKDINLPLATDNIIMCVGNLRSSAGKLLESIRTLSNVAEYKVNIQKSISCLMLTKKS